MYPARAQFELLVLHNTTGTKSTILKSLYHLLEPQ